MKTYTGKCHCGAVSFSFKSSESEEIWICNCSICAITDYQHLFIEKGEFKLLSGEEFLSEYKFGTSAARHLFCSICGIKIFYEPRSHPTSVSVNLRCVESPPEIKSVVAIDGKNKF